MLSFKKITGIIAAFAVAIAAITPVSVQPNMVCAASKINLNKKSAAIKVGKTVQLKVKGTKEKVKWSSSNTYVAKVTQKGKVTGKHKGSAKITAKISSKKLTCKIKVKGAGKTVVTKAPEIPTIPTRIPSVTEAPVNPIKTPPVTEVPVSPVKTPPVTETPVSPVKTPPVTETPVSPVKTPPVTEVPVSPVKTPPVTEVPVSPTNLPFVTETPGKQVELKLNFYLDEYDSESPSEQFVNVHLVNHLTEDVYVEAEAYLTTKGKNYPAMISGSKEGDLKKIEPTFEEDTYGDVVMYDSKEYVMGNYTDETFWLTSDENSTLTFYFRIGEQRYKATINYNETGAVFREAGVGETLLPAETKTPIASKEPISTVEPSQTPGKQVELKLNFYLDEYDSESPSEQFVNVHLVNHLTEDVYVEAEAYLTTKGKNYPAMISGSKEGDLKKIEPTFEEDTYGDVVMYDSKEYVMGNYTDETFWLASDENSTLTFYFHIGEQRYKATINYNETGAVFREAGVGETLLPAETKTPIISEESLGFFQKIQR